LPDARPALRLPKAADMVVAEVRDRILTGRLKQGDWLPPEADLMTEFRVSRPTLREAFRVLEADGLITIRRGSQGGAQVHIPTADIAAQHAALVLQLQGVTLADVFDAKLTFEVPAVGVVARRRTAAQIRQLEDVLAREETLLDHGLVAGVAALDEFHQLLVEFAGNRTIGFLSLMIQSIVTRSNDERFPDTLSTRDRQQMVDRHDHHVRLLELIRARDVDGAEHLWRLHLGTPARNLRAPVRTPATVPSGR
jgi:DNA-binding FadR family transcriptional regulator